MTKTHSTPTTSIALKDLILWKGNVRKTNIDEGIEALAISIRTTGLLQSLAVIPSGRKFAVVAGGRRLAALELLRGEGFIDENHLVPCTVLESEHALEASLAENAMRVAMHPADQFDAFQGLLRQGLSLPDVAARFGVSERTVEQRLKLARVHPAILKAYRNEETDLECVMAFAVVDDAKKQLRLWKSLPERLKGDADHIRSALTEGDIDAADRRVRFVSTQAYEAAGGTTRRDLFTDGEHGLFILQRDVLDELARAKLESIRATVAAEGWAWTEVRDDFDYAERSRYRRIHAEPQASPADLQSEVESLEAERERLYERDDEDASPRLAEIEKRLDAIEQQQTYAWPEGTFEAAGAIITIGYDGEPDITRGLVRRENEKRREKNAAPKDPDAVPASLVRSLKGQRSSAIAAELAGNPEIALQALVCRLVGDVFFSGEALTSLRVSAKPVLPDDETSIAQQRLLAEQAVWEELLPESEGTLWTWCRKQDLDTLLSLLAVCAALCVDAVSHDEPFLADALGLDMGKWYAPTAANYFSKISKAQILGVLRDVKGSTAPAWEKLSRTELALIAEREIAGTGWLPQPVRGHAQPAEAA